VQETLQPQDDSEPGAAAPSSPRLLALVAAVVACALVAVAARDVRLVLPGAALSETWVRVVRGVGALAVLAGLAGLLIQRRRLPRTSRREPDPTAVALRTAAVVMGLLTVLALTIHPLPPRAGPSRSAAGSSSFDPSADESGAQPGGTRPGGLGGGMGVSQPGGAGGGVLTSPLGGPVGPPAGPPQSLLQRLGRMLPLILGLLILGLIYRIMRRQNRPSPRGLRLDMPGVARDDAQAGLEASLTEMALSEGEPRDVITAAYRRLLHTLAAAGAPRQAYEAPHEHLRRSLGPLGVRPDSLHRLAELYVRAQFADRPVTEAHRGQARAALQESLTSLRAVHAIRTEAGA
jgi:hypothetical protein